MDERLHRLIKEIIEDGRGLTDWERQFIGHMEDYSEEDRNPSWAQEDQIRLIHSKRVKP